MTEIFTAPTLEEAKQKAADAFGAPVSEITFTVIEEPKRSILGGLFGKKDAECKVRAEYQSAEAPAEEAVTAPVEQADLTAPAAEAIAEESADAPAAEEKNDDRPAWEDIPEEIRLAKMQLAV